MNALLNQIATAVVEMDDEAVVSCCTRALEAGIDAKTIIEKGLVEGMNTVSAYFEDQTYFLPEILICSDTFNLGLSQVKPHLRYDDGHKTKKIVIGVVAGDTHDIGKNIVRIMMESAGFTCYDLGRDVPLEAFIDKAEEVDADIICMSTLMTTTMTGMKTVVDRLKERQIRDKYTVMIGGGPISNKFAEDIGADYYTKDASEAVKCIRHLS